MCDYLSEQYDEYIERYRAWGHEYFGRELSFEEYEDLSAEMEMIESEEEFGKLTKKQRNRRREIELKTLVHQSYFTNGPRIRVVLPPGRQARGPEDLGERGRRPCEG